MAQNEFNARHGITVGNVPTPVLDALANLTVKTIATTDALATNVLAGNLVVGGNLTIQGSVVTVNSATLDIADKNITIANGSVSDATSAGGGITLKGTTDKTITWNNATNGWESSESIQLAVGKTYRINGVDVISANALGTTVVASSLTSVGIIGTGTWQGSVVQPAYGGTGVNNGTKTITLGGSLSTIGAFSTAITVTANTSVTLPVTGTLATWAGTETLTNKSISGATNTLSAIPNSALTNSSVTIGSTSISLGSSSTTLTGLTSVTSTSFVGALTGNASTATKLQTAKYIGDTLFDGSYDMFPSRITYKDTSNTNYTPYTWVGLSSHIKTNTTDGLSDGGTYHGVLDVCTWSDASGSSDWQMSVTANNNAWIRTSINATTWTAWKKLFSTSDADSANTASTLVIRDASGNFSAGTITASLNGNATTSTTLQTARTINGVSFNGSTNITIEDATKLPLTGGTINGQVFINSGTNNTLVLTTSSAIPSHLTFMRSDLGLGTTINNFSGTQLDFEHRPAFVGNLAIDVANIGNYAPSLTGTGASGTWGISITGNAATSTSVSNGSRGITADTANTWGAFSITSGQPTACSIRLFGSTGVWQGTLYAVGGSQGFLNSSLGWNAYTDNSGNWFATTSVRAPIFYDSENTAYFVDPNGTSNLTTVTCITMSPWTLKPGVATVATNTTLTSGSASVILANGTLTVTLPAASLVSRMTITIKNIGTGIVTIDGNASETIDGQISISIGQYQAVTLICDGTAWWII